MTSVTFSAFSKKHVNFFCQTVSIKRNKYFNITERNSGAGNYFFTPAERSGRPSPSGFNVTPIRLYRCVPSAQSLHQLDCCSVSFPVLLLPRAGRNISVICGFTWGRLMSGMAMKCGSCVQFVCLSLQMLILLKLHGYGNDYDY